MPLASNRYRWPYQINVGDTYEFVVETLALTNVLTIFDPVLRIHNMGIPYPMNVELTITYKASFGTSSDPLNSGTFTKDVVAGQVVGPQDLYDYNFSGIPLTKESTDVVSVTHTVALQNLGADPVSIQAVLYGKTEVGGQYNAGSTIFTGISS
jgi:hypothetical protein